MLSAFWKSEHATHTTRAAPPMRQILKPRLRSANTCLPCWLLLLLVADLLAWASAAWAQESVVPKIDPSGLPPIPSAVEVLTGSDPQPLIPKNLVQFSARLHPENPRSDEFVRLLITARIHEGWSIYSIAPQTAEFAPPPTQLNIEAAALKAIGPAYETNPKQKVDPVLRETLWVHEGQARFYQNLAASKNVVLGEKQLQAQVRYQACSDRICTPQLKAHLQIPFTLEQGSVRPAYTYMERTVDFVDKQGRLHEDPSKIDAALSQGLSSFLLLAVSFGFLALLTPCVFPMIPVTVGFFTQASENHGTSTTAKGSATTKQATQNMRPPNPWAGIKLASLFGAGLVFTCVGVGLVLTFLLGAAGVNRFASHPAVNLTIAAFFTLFALSLLGVFQPNLRASWIQRINLSSQKIHGPLGAIFMGFAFTITSFTCTMPFVGSLLVTASQGALFWPVLGMTVFALVFATPFVLLALFPHALRHFRGKSGEWLNWVKFALGAVELMAALKFVGNADLVLEWNIFTREVILAMWVLIAIAVSAITLGLLPWPWLQSGRLNRPWRWSGGFAFAMLGLWLTYGWQGGALASVLEAQLPPPASTNVAAVRLGAAPSTSIQTNPGDKLWLSSLPQALKQAQATNKRIFVDFTGYTCINCRWMERSVFEKPKVHATLKENFVLLRLYTDGGPNFEEHQTLQAERFGTIALPFYVILSPKNTLLARWAGVFPNSKAFLQWLKPYRTAKINK